MLVSSAPLVAHLACSGFVSVFGFGLVSGECRVEPIKSAFSENLSRRRKVGTAGAFSHFRLRQPVATSVRVRKRK